MTLAPITALCLAAADSQFGGRKIADAAEEKALRLPDRRPDALDKDRRAGPADYPESRCGRACQSLGTLGLSTSKTPIASASS